MQQGQTYRIEDGVHMGLPDLNGGSLYVTDVEDKREDGTQCATVILFEPETGKGRGGFLLESEWIDLGYATQIDD